MQVFPKFGTQYSRGPPQKQKGDNLYDIYPLAIRTRRIRQCNHSQPDRSYSGANLRQCAAAYQSGEREEGILRPDIRSHHQGADHAGRWQGHRLRADAPHYR